MSASLSKSFLLSSAEEVMDSKKQGIVSILGSDAERPTKATSLRRTLSADMSSRKWLSPLKKSPSSQEFPVPSSFEEEGENEAPDQSHIWASIQHEKKQPQNPSQFDIWSSIISQKAEQESFKSSPPYIHPLVKRSTSCLSEKSLEICTESLGSETGSDGFSSETGEVEEDQHLQHQKQETLEPMMMPCFHGEKATTVKYSYDVGKKSPNPSFPPPIPSLSGKGGASRRLKTHRDNGKLVIEAVSMPSLNNFLAQRQDGRLVLTFANTTAPSEAPEEESKEVGELEEEFENFGEKESEIGIDDDDDGDDDDDDDDDEGEEESEIGLAPKLSCGAMNVHRLAVMMNKPIWLANRRNPTWPKNFDEIVNFGEEREGKVESNSPPPLAQSLPPRPSPSKAAGVGAASSFNAYEYYWRRPNQGMSKTAAAVVDPLAQQSPPGKDDSKLLILTKNLMANKDQQHLQVLEGKKGDYIVPLLKGCKEPRRSLLLWEPYSIATS
ncbi:hypothetical protein ES319_D09G112800v1 [Gossypium barbadense]|uniref:FAF domain-containing protein n=1 Tax=Gossypium barbadense TaxID=3634 RepID=A0A5J5Q1E3_GOSBA|nr:hypothetical protein ES319_D09G112800v1 [Gossypium barbadense]